MWVLLPLLALIGLTLGLVINVLADNLPPDADDIRHPPRRPRCRHCGQPHRPAHWLGLAGWLLARGRCEHCGGRRLLRPVVVELAAAVITPALWLWTVATSGEAPPLDLALRFLSALVLAYSLLLITVIDIEHRLILWIVIWPTALALIALAALRSLSGWIALGPPLTGNGLVKTLAGGLAGYGLTLGVFLLAELYTRVMQAVRGRPLEEVAFGGGDVNLAGVVGLAVGWPGVLLSLTIAILAGGMFSLAFIVVQLLRRRYTPHSAFPYGPFLVLGASVIYFFGRELEAAYLAGQ
jgi:prepilin signal peptidase PulO-like enzyme (type II secretory pathway)